MDVPFGVRVRPPGKQTYGLLPGCEPAGHSGLLVVVSLDYYSLVCLLPWWKEHAKFLRRESMYDRLLFPVSQSPSCCGLGHAQAGKPERDPLQFTRDRRLAAQHGLHLFGRCEQLVGLAHGEMLARLSLDMVDEGRQVAAGLRRIVVRQIGLHRL